MQITRFFNSVWLRIKQRPQLAGAALILLVAVAIVLTLTSKPAAAALSFYKVKRGDFLVSVVEGGTLEAVREVSIRSEMEGTARIIFIVPEGSYVKKGQLLVELDSSTAQDSVNQQQINVEKAQFALVQAEQQLEIQKSIVDSEVQSATLKVEFAESDLEKFVKGEALQMQRNAQIEITNVLESLQIAKERLEWSEKLYAEGFETKGNLDKDRLTVSQTTLKLEQAEKDLWMIETFDIPKRKRTLESALQEAEENLDRVKLQGERKLAQFAADLETQKKTLELNMAKLERERRQLAAAKIEAPQDGLVVYGSAGSSHFSSESLIEEGAVVRNRQEIIKLPDTSEMKVQVKIHESHITQLQRGLPAYVVLDSIPDRRFAGVVTRVAPLPDSQSRWGNPDLKLYATEIVIKDKLPDLKPGVSARAEIIVTNLSDVLSVPIQCVTSLGGKQVVYLADASTTPVPVSIGQFNSKFIEIVDGLSEGDHVLLAPPLDAKERDLGGAIVREGESVPKGATNDTISSESSVPPEQTRGPSGPGETFIRTMAQAENGASEGPGDGTAPERSGRRFRGFGEAGSTNRQEFIKRFDTDGDGTLSEAEQSAMRDSFRRMREENPRPPRGGQEGDGTR